MQDRTDTIDWAPEGADRPEPHYEQPSPKLNPADEALRRARASDARRAVTRLLANQPHLTETEAYRSHYSEEIGPRFVGTVYVNDSGTFEVKGVHFGDEARTFLAYAEWTVTLHNQVTGQTVTVCERWSSRDRIVSQPAEVLAGVTV
jgi:hypothetical protein